MNPTNKEILQDPVTVYASLYTDSEAGRIPALEELWHQLQLFKQQHDQTKTQANIISRKIGDAKRNGETIDELKTAMQDQSVQLNSIIDQIGTIENKILGFFNPATDSKTQPDNSTTLDGERIYSSSVGSTSTATISLIENKHGDWNRYVENNPAASIYHRGEWKNIIGQIYGHECYNFAAFDREHNIVGVLQLIRLKSRLFGDLLVSMPYFMTGGAIADDKTIEHKLMQAANELAANLDSEHIEYRDDIPREAFPVRSDKVNMILPLPDSEQALWEGFTSKLRSQIRRPQRENPQISFGGVENLNDFYTVYARNMRDLGSPVHSKQLVKAILDHFPDKSRLVIVKLNHRPVSACLLISNGETLDIPLASTLREFNHLSINMLLYWEVLKFAVKHGYRFFNFGRSTKGAETYRFKQQWGAKPKQLYWHYWLKSSDELPSLNPSNPKYALMIKVWKRLPVAISNWIGPKIVKNLP